jgi:NTE family protein
MKLLRGAWGASEAPSGQPGLSGLPLLRGASKRALRSAESATRWFSLPGGRTLFDVGDPADEAYFLVAGALVAHRPSQSEAEGVDIIGHIRPGEPVGEMAMLLGEKHTTAVSALRDSELLALSRKDFHRLARAHPEFYEGLSRLMLLRSRAQRTGRERTNPKVFALLSTSPSIDVPSLTRTLKDKLALIGRRCIVVGEEAGDRPTGWFDQLEHENDVVILAARIEDTHWYRVCLRQADRLWVLARRDARPSRPMPLAPDPGSPARRFRLVDMVILPFGAPTGAAPLEWFEAVGAARLFYWRTDADVARLVRVMAGLSTGLVLSGGGARAYAHIGAIRALREAGIPFDFIGGTSMGAIIGAGVALGWSDDEIHERVHDAFVKSNPLGDIRLPVVALTSGDRVDSRLAAHFGDVRIEDLQTPFFAISSNLTTGAARVHRSGLLRDALRASSALPGILPPVVENGEVFVDGAVLDNFPVDIMQATQRGPIIGIDVARAGTLDPADFADPPGFVGWVRRYGIHSPPPIASLLIRAATVNIKPWHGRDSVDLLIVPDLKEIELRNWKSFDQAIVSGYEAAAAAIEGCSDRLNTARAAARALASGV